MNDPAPPPPKWDLAFLKMHVFSIWGMVGLLGLTVVTMMPVMLERSRAAFLLFVCAMLAHFTIQFLLTVGIDDIAHRRKPRRRRIQMMQSALLLLTVPPFIAAYFS